MEPRYNEVIRTMKISFLYQVSHIKKAKKYKELGPAKLPCYKRATFHYIRPLYNEVPLYNNFVIDSPTQFAVDFKNIILLEARRILIFMNGIMYIVETCYKLLVFWMFYGY